MYRHFYVEIFLPEKFRTLAFLEPKTWKNGEKYELRRIDNKKIKKIK